MFLSQKWKKISFEEYSKHLDKFNKKYSDISEKWRGICDCDVRKSLLPEYINGEVGSGIMNRVNANWSKLAENATDDDYEYFIKDGTEWVIVGNQEFIDNYNKILKDACK